MGHRTGHWSSGTVVIPSPGSRVTHCGVFGAAGGATSGHIQGQRGWKLLADAGIGAAFGALGGAPTNPYLQVGAWALTGLGNGAAQQLAANDKVVDWRGAFIDAGLGAGTAGIGIPYRRRRCSAKTWVPS